MKVGDIVEHIDKISKSGYPHDKKYLFSNICRMKNPTTREWVDAAQYKEVDKANGDIYVRELSDFKKHFKVCSKDGSKD